jgi:RNA polymerase sigma factor (sigma-70 family)
MSAAAELITRRMGRSADLPGYLFHPSFDEALAGREYDPAAVLKNPVSYDDRYMPDDVTRDHSRRMHYAAHRVHVSRRTVGVARWRRTYYAIRDRIVLGNRKLIYRAVRRRMAACYMADDLIGDCHLVLIQAVAAFNPWFGTRFSTYAYTCLMRELAHAARRLTTDRLARALPLEALPDGEPDGYVPAEPPPASQLRIDVFLQDDHPLLSPREKKVIAYRYSLYEEGPCQTLETVGRAVGLSKERVRQVQLAALQKLRGVLTPAAQS